MNTAWQKAKRTSGGVSQAESQSIDHSEYPQLSCFLGGIPDENGRSWKLAPHTLTLWVDGDLLSFCLQSQLEANKVFGSVRNVSGGLAAVEEALALEQFSVRKKKQ